VWWLLWVGLAMAALYGLHRLALWAEGRGWIYYRTHRMPVGSAGMAMLEITSLLDPAAEHVVEELRDARSRAEQDESGEGSPGR
jgi:hypothetical protein